MHTLWEWYYRLRSRIDLNLRYVSIAWLWWLLSAAVFATGLVVDFLLNPRVSTTKVLLAGLLLYEVYALVRERREIRHTVNQLDFQAMCPNKLKELNFTLNEQYRQSQYAVFQHHDVFFLYSREINRYLSIKQLRYEVHGKFQKAKVFRTIAPVVLLKSLQQAPIIFKEAKVGLCVFANIKVDRFSP
ncbi:MAG: hypothetical protein AB1426_04600 [Bacillota bacterium]